MECLSSARFAAPRSLAEQPVAVKCVVLPFLHRARRRSVDSETEMRNEQRSLLALMLVGLAACAARGSGAAPNGAEPARASATPSPAEKAAEPETEAPPERPPSLDERVAPAIRAGEYRRAEEILEQAAADPRQAAMVAYYRSTLRAFQNDFEGAEAELQAYLARESTPASDPMRPTFHNCLMMLREADGDLAGALVEFHEMARTGAAGKWGDEVAKMYALKEIWHRAYLYRIAAESADGAARAALLRYAEAARAEYTRTAIPPEEYADSVAVLEAYFALRDGDTEAALAAARRVNVDENGDLEDLYLTSIALAFGGDAEAAAAVRRKITGSEAVYLAAPIMRAWVEQDTSGNAALGRWTPLNLRK